MATIEEIAEQLDKLSLLDAAKLSKLLQEKWGVSAAAPVAVAAMPGSAGGGGGGGPAGEGENDLGRGLVAAREEEKHGIQEVRRVTGRRLHHGQDPVVGS